jgi:AraC-like DNA-binding protein
VQAAHAWTPRRAAATRQYGCEVAWNSRAHALWFERQALLVRWPAGNRDIARSFERWVDQKLIGPARPHFARQVLLALQHGFGRGDFSQSATARALGMSVRSFQRRLHCEGSSYTQLYMSALRRVGTPLLRDCSRSTQEIALSLGYSDAGSFARAWKRLTGDTPARYRARLCAPPELLGEAGPAQERRAS